MERRYKCVLESKEHRLEVNVFTTCSATKEQLKPLATKRGVELMRQMGSEAAEADIKLIRFKDCGKWPLFK